MAWIKIEGQKFALQNLDNFTPSTLNSKKVIEFINSWQSVQQSFEFQTSGSTGKPKQITISRNQMQHSAQMTLKALGLKPQSTALLCMNPSFIGGKMMIVRSLMNEMNLVVTEPASSPFEAIHDQIDFAALVPLQLANALGNKESLKKIKSITNIIVGGGEVSHKVKKVIKSFNNNIYSTYGMTETVSHIGLQLLSKQSVKNYFTTLDGVNINLDTRGCLTIKAPVTNNELVVTNDRVELISSNTFKWLGRIDNIINTGGIKVQIELVENMLVEIFNSFKMINRFIIKGIKDDSLGEKVILIIEGNVASTTIQKLKEGLKSRLPKYEKPKEIHVISKFEETPTGKIIRNIDYPIVTKTTV